jgi:hypothetical protein
MKNGRPNFTTYFRHLLHKKSNFCHLENGKIRFYSKKIIIAMQTLSTMVTLMVVPNLDMLL